MALVKDQWKCWSGRWVLHLSVGVIWKNKARALVMPCCQSCVTESKGKVQLYKTGKGSSLLIAAIGLVYIQIKNTGCLKELES